MVERGGWWWWGLLGGVLLSLFGIQLAIMSVVAVLRHDWTVAVIFALVTPISWFGAVLRMGLWGGPLTNGRFDRCELQ